MFILTISYSLEYDCKEVEVEVFQDLQQAIQYAQSKCKEFADNHEIPTHYHQWGDDNEQTQYVEIKYADVCYLIEDCNTNRMFVQIHTKHITI